MTCTNLVHSGEIRVYEHVYEYGHNSPGNTLSSYSPPAAAGEVPGPGCDLIVGFVNNS
jgi:hypothetical protein